MELNALAQEVGELLKSKGLTLGTVESATGGLISHSVTNIPGSSEYYRGSVIAYKNDVKIKVIGVSADTLEKHGSVSGQTAEEMALGGKRLLEVDICIADTGIAGPSGATEEKPVGFFYLGLADKNGALNQRHKFYGDREQNKESAAEAALMWLKERLLVI